MKSKPAVPRRLHDTGDAPDFVMAHQPKRGAMAPGNEARFLEHLIERYGVVKGWQTYYMAELEKVGQHLIHLEGTIRFFKEDWNSAEARPRMPTFRYQYMKMGEGAGTACDVLREATLPLTIREIVKRSLIKLGVEETKLSVRSLECAVRYLLEKKRPDNVRRIEGKPLRFEVIH